VLASLIATSALGRPHLRRHFEPTDLELQEPGVTELDTEVGLIRGQSAWRVVAPDFELDLGLARWLELDLDGAFAIEGAADRPFSFDHTAPDPLWPSLKVGALDLLDDGSRSTFAFGAQAGPKLPTLPGSHGVGAEALLLGGVKLGRTELVLNVGGFVDPAPTRASQRVTGLESGVTWAQDLDRLGRYSLNTDLSAVLFPSGDPSQVQATFGPAVQATEWLDLSLTTLVGFTAGSDRYGMLLGFSPHARVWKVESEADTSP
jgi:hypothetical protein